MTAGTTAAGDEELSGRRVRSRAERRDALVRSALTTLGKVACRLRARLRAELHAERTGDT